MPEEEISPDQWDLFFDRLSLARQGWYIAVEESTREELEANPLLFEAEEMAPGGQPRLQQIACRGSGEARTIVIDAGEKPAGFQHVIKDPVAVASRVSDDKTDVELHITNRRQMTTIIHLRNPVLPNTVQGDFEPELRGDNPDPDRE